MTGDLLHRDPDWQRIDALFCACLDLDAAGREALLARECADAPRLRDRVGALLAASQREDELLSRRDAMLGGLFPLDDGPGLEPGTWLGEYRIERLIGEGGMARVYLAEQHHADWRRKVAIKVLKVGGADLLARFNAERRILASLEHPGIARLIDTGTTGDDQPYLVTEFVEGEPIHRHCRRLALSVPARLDLFLQLADAVQHAHARLVIHRDIKPSNVLVDGEGRVRLLDFGIAKLIESDDDGPSTRHGQLPMTHEYAAPEQLAGGAISTSIDIYQLGLMLFELLTDQAPWSHWGVGPEPGARLLPRASEAAGKDKDDGRERSRRLRGDLDAVIARATATVPGERYATVQGLARDIRCHLRGERTSVRSEGLASATWRLVRKNRVASAAVAGLLAAVVGWLVTLQLQTARLERERQAVAREAMHARQAKAFLLDIFQRADPLDQPEPGPDEVIAWRWLPQVEADARRTLAGTPGVQAEILESIGLLYLRAGHRDDAERLLLDALALQQEIGPAGRYALARLQAQLASLLAEDGRTTEARTLLNSSLADLDGMAASEPATALAVLLDAAATMGEFGEHQTRVGHMRRALDLLASPGNASPTTEAEARLQLTNALGELGDNESALAESTLALERANASLGPGHGRMVALLSAHAKALRILGQPVEAEEALRHALEIQLRWDQPGSRTVLSLRNNLALALGEAGKRPEEQQEFRLLLDLRREALGADHIEVGRLWQNLAASLAKTGDNEAAGEALEEAARIFDLQLPPNHPQRAFPRITHALVDLQSGQPARAEAQARAAADLLRASLPEGHYAHAVAGCLLAEARHQQQPRAESLAELRTWAERLGTDPAAPADYRQRCRDAARATP
ncbi:serine/threonine-protein kinase [Arenimonas sp.]|uniref:serine/threonine-protein kinase n=1 Tax=Arenimonas sp. TaxID=1872635 RepID=UPI0025F3CAB1|nr:serine/threonine-protein kinase [Arenimonas sp.]